MKKFFVIAFLFIINSVQYSQWVQTSGPSGGSVSAIVSSGSVMYAANGVGGFGYGSGLYKSTDNGVTWKTIEYTVINRSDKNVSSVVVSGNFIAFSAQGGLVVISHDNGVTWQRTNIGTTNVTALVTDGTNLFASTNGDGVYVTPISSTSWVKVNSGLSNKKVTSLSIAGTTLFATVLGGGEIFSTTNNGISWTSIPLPATVFNTYVSLLVNNTLYVGAQDGVYTTLDNGVNWSGPIAGLIHSTSTLAVSGNTLLAGNEDGLFSVPLSGGNFTSVTNQFGVLSLLVNSLGIWAGTQHIFMNRSPGIFLSTNNGVNWSQSGDGFAGSTIQTVFEFGNKIFAIKNSKGIYSSTDKGITWILSDLSSNSYDGLVQLIAEKNGKLFVAAENGIITSSDTGSTWNYLSADFTPQALFVYGSKIFAGEQNGVRISTDDGVSWTQSNNGLTGYLSTNVFAASNGVLFLGKFDGGVYTSIDEGVNWVLSNSGLSSTRVRTFAFIGSTTLVGTDDGGVFKSIDYGLNWVSSNSGMDSQDVSNLVTSGDNVFAASYNGVRISSDSGATWHNTSPWDMICITLCLTSTDIYCGTYAAGVWRRPLTDFVTDVNDYSQTNLEVFSLEQNYPNPFNPSTIIKINTTTSGHVNLRVYDILGHEVATLINENKQAGSYSIEYSASKYGLGSGVYFYTLETAGNKLSRKMILLK